MEPIWQLITALVSTGTLAAGIHLARDVVRKRASRKIDQGFSNIQKVYIAMQELLSGSSCTRVLVLKSENGGGIPGPGAHVKSSVVAEICDSSVKPIQNAWQQIAIDRVYSEILADVVSQGSHILVMKELDLNTVIRDLVEACECNMVYFLRVCATPSALFYLAVNYSEVKELDARERVGCRKTAQQIRYLLGKHHNVVKLETTRD